MRSWSSWFRGACVALLLPLSAAAQSNGLALTIDVSQPTRPTEQEQELVAVLRNVGERPIELLLPLHRRMVPFPDWELVDAAGRVVRPTAKSFQSMWKDGLQGELLRLAPGAEARFTSHVQLAAGTWTARCRHERADDWVPWSDEAFEVVRRRLPGLWVGRVEAAPVRFVVGERERPGVRLEVPRDVACGASHPLHVRLLPGAAPREPFRAAFELVAGAKAYGSGTLRLVLRDGALVPAGPEEFAQVDPARLAEHAVGIDLARVSFHRQRGTTTLGLYDFVPQGLFHLSLKVVAEDGSTWASGGAEGHIAAPADASASGLRLRVEATSQPRVVDVVLQNDGPSAVRVPAVLIHPRHVSFGLHPRLAGRPRPIVSVTHTAGSHGLLMDPDEPTDGAVLPRTLSWDGDRFEDDLTYERAGTVRLAPGGELRRRFDLDVLITGPRAALDEPLRLKARWRNREPGWRLGFAEPLVTGRIESAPLDLPAREG